MRFKILFKLNLFILSCNNKQVGLASTTVNSPGKAMMMITMMIHIFSDWSSDTHASARASAVSQYLD